MTPSQSTALLPCPFCGDIARAASEYDQDGTVWHYVKCCGCGARTRGKWHSAGNDCPQLRAEVRDEWNQRSAATLRGMEKEGPSPVAWRVRGYSQFKTGTPRPWRYFDGAERPKVNIPSDCDFEPLYAQATPHTDHPAREVNACPHGVPHRWPCEQCDAAVEVTEHTDHPAPRSFDESKLPPRPAGSNDANTDPDSPLVRYGRAGPGSGLLLEPMADGYWTPWHIANELLRAASVQGTEAQSAPIWKRHEERIKQLMEQVGMPNSMSLFQAFKQFAYEFSGAPPEQKEGASVAYRAWVLAQNFHAVYERLAPDFGYTTRPETRGWVADSPNGKLMRAVCAELISSGEVARAISLPAAAAPAQSTPTKEKENGK